MPPLSYHAGQIAVQEEAKTRHVADKLAHWVGPVDEFALGADMLLFATADTDGILSFAVLSGEPPLVDVVGESELRLRFPPDLPPLSSRSPTPCGGLAISLGEARRARINGTLIPNDGTSELVAAETFTLCRKYMAPSLALEERPHLGPVACEPLALDDPWSPLFSPRPRHRFWPVSVRAADRMSHTEAARRDSWSWTRRRGG
jgi:hypothetical protein